MEMAIEEDISLWNTEKCVYSGHFPNLFCKQEHSPPFEVHLPSSLPSTFPTLISQFTDGNGSSFCAYRPGSNAIHATQKACGVQGWLVTPLTRESRPCTTRDIRWYRRVLVKKAFQMIGSNGFCSRSTLSVLFCFSEMKQFYFSFVIFWSHLSIV